VSAVMPSGTTPATRIGLDLSAPFLPESGSEAFDAMMAPYADMVSAVVEQKTLRKRDAAMRKLGERVRALAMGGIVRGNVRDRKSELSATAA
jgi:hypothetical protein